MKGTISSKGKSLCLYSLFCRRSFTPSPLHNFRDGIVYNAQLFIIECKNVYDLPKASTIFKLDSVANAFGAGFVGKYLITRISATEISRNSNIQEQMEVRKIRLITLEELTKLKEIFAKEVEDPQYPRI